MSMEDVKCGKGGLNMINMINRNVAFDLETTCILSDIELKRWQDEKVAKINKNKTYKDKTKLGKIEEIEKSILEIKTGIPNKLKETIVKEFSVNPLKNRICAIGMTYRNKEGELVEKALAGKDEGVLVDMFFDTIEEFMLENETDPTLVGHNVILFDIATLKIAIIRNKKRDRIEQLNLKNRRLLFPFSKYSHSYIDSMNLYNAKLNEISLAVTGEGKIDNGSKVYQMYLDGDFDRMTKYVQSDATLSFMNIEELTM
jgi:hypothetical protein